MRAVGSVGEEDEGEERGGREGEENKETGEREEEEEEEERSCDLKREKMCVELSKERRGLREMLLKMGI